MMKKIALLLVAIFFSVNVFSQPTIQWHKPFGGSENDYAWSVIQVTDGGYVIAGTSTSNDYEITGHHGSSNFGDYLIVKLDISGGNIQWQKSLGGTDHDAAFSIILTTDGGYMAVGSSQSNDGDVTGNNGYY